MKRSRLRRRLAGATLLVALPVAGAAALFGVSYPGVSRRLVDHARSATLGETRNLFACILYWIGAMERLVPDGRGVYRFAEPSDYGDEGLDTCRTRYHRGELARAVACVEAHIAARGESEEALFWLGMSALRRAEAVNCLEPLLEDGRAAHAAGPMCSLPLLRPHERRELALQAAGAFERLLERHDDDDPLYLWLLNLCHMAAGDFPAGVPERHRIASPFIERYYGTERDRRRERYRHLRFRDRAAELGVAVHDAGRGVAVEDFDGDGDLDLVVAGAFSVIRYFENQGGTRFAERTATVGLAGVVQPFSVSAADYDDDGRMDLFVARPFDRYALFRNEGGRFREVTEEVGLEVEDGRIAATWTAAWGDVEGDGDLDLFLAQWGMRLPFVDGVLARPRMDSALFLNEGGRFVERTAELGLAGVVADEYFLGATFGDYDLDGYPDLFLSSPVRRASVLLHNRGGRRFEAVAGSGRPTPGFYAAFVDADQDGRLDLFQGGFSDARSSTEQAVFGRHLESWRAGRSAILFQGAGDAFTARPEAFGGGRTPLGTMGASYGDLNNDGCPDFYLGTGNPESWFVLPNLMYVGERSGRRCTGSLADVSMLEGFGTLQKGHGIVFFDFDGDGDQDVYSALGGMWPGDAWPNQLFVNESRLERSWVEIRLRGTRTNRFGVGARVKVVAVAPDGSEIVRYQTIDNRTGFGSSPYLAHFGLLDAREIRAVEVFWPASRCMQRYRADLGRRNVLEEGPCPSSGAALVAARSPGEDGTEPKRR